MFVSLVALCAGLSMAIIIYMVSGTMKHRRDSGLDDWWKEAFGDQPFEPAIVCKQADNQG